MLNKILNSFKRLFTGIKNSAETTSNYLKEECGPLGRAFGKLLSLGLTVGLPILFLGPLAGIIVALEWHFIFKPVGLLFFGIGKGIFRGLQAFRDTVVSKTEEVNERNSKEVFKEIDQSKEVVEEKTKAVPVVPKVAEEKTPVKKDAKAVDASHSQKEPGSSFNAKATAVSDEELASRGYELDRLYNTDSRRVYAQVLKYLEKNNYKDINAWIIANPDKCVATSVEKIADLKNEYAKTHKLENSPYSLTRNAVKLLNEKDRLLESNQEIYKSNASENIAKGIGLDKYASSKVPGVAQIANTWLENNGYANVADWFARNPGLALSVTLPIVKETSKAKEPQVAQQVKDTPVQTKTTSTKNTYQFTTKTMGGVYNDKSSKTATSTSHEHTQVTQTTEAMAH